MSNIIIMSGNILDRLNLELEKLHFDLILTQAEKGKAQAILEQLKKANPQYRINAILEDGIINITEYKMIKEETMRVYNGNITSYTKIVNDMIAIEAKIRSDIKALQSVIANFHETGEIIDLDRYRNGKK